MTAATKPNDGATAASPQPTVQASAPAKKVVRKSAARKAAAKTSSRAAAPAQKPAVKKPVAKKTVSQVKKPLEVKEQPAKKPKQKLVRDSFTMPSNDFQLIDQLKHRALGFKRPTKKSELLRAGLHALNSLSDAKLKTALDALDPLKPGRPRKTPV